MPELGDGWDMVGFGVAAVDDVFITHAFPAPGEKTTFSKYLRVGGGQTATAFVAASRLGCRCFYAGHLGDDDLSAMVRAVFIRENIGHRKEMAFPQARPTHTLVIVNSRSGERTNVANLREVQPADIGTTEEKLIAGAKCLFVDQSIPECQVQAAQVALSSNVPIVGDLESAAGSARGLYELVDHLILPLNVAVRDLGATGPEDAVRIMMRDGRRALACVTDGDRGAWYATSQDPERVGYQPAFVMPEVVDTNGCGDVFHGAYAVGLVRGLPIKERIRRAAAAAAIKTQKLGGQTGAPNGRELDEFLAGC